MKVQHDQNHGLLGGWLISTLWEPVPGHWELHSSRWLPRQLAQGHAPQP